MNNIVKWRRKLLSPVKNSSWASEMVLNPAIIKDPKTSRIHMLFRATGPFSSAQLPGKPLPYPIFLGYGYSDNGTDFSFDLDRPALAPALHYEKDEIKIKNVDGASMVDYSNGCIEDPRLFWIEGTCYLSVACRMFPPGAYWIKDDPVQCMPMWAKGNENPYATQTNPTVTVLYQVDLDALSNHEYEKAFHYVTNLTDPAFGEDRDVVFFPKRMKVENELCYIMLHRPVCPKNYAGETETRPSIFIAAAKKLSDFAANRCVRRKLIMAPVCEWQAERVGVSTPPILCEDGRWLVNYHGKQDDEVGYGQSFMIFKEQDNSVPVIDFLCNEKLIVPEAEFEQPSKFTTPCIFFTGMIRYDGDLLVSYGAADENIGLMRIDYKKLLGLFHEEKSKSL